jgi:hypothetical protein
LIVGMALFSLGFIVARSFPAWTCAIGRADR